MRPWGGLWVLWWTAANGLIKNPNIPDQLPRDDFVFFKTRPDILAPRWEIDVHNEDQLSPGYWFTAIYEDLTAKVSTKRYIGPGIYDSNGHLIWSAAGTLDHADVFDFRVTQFQGAPCISLISLHSGAGYVLDSQYQVIRRFRMGKFGSTMNMHEFNIVENGSRALTLHRNLTYASRAQTKELGVHGKCSIAAHFLRESDITGNASRTIFEWHMLDHIPLSESTNLNDTVDVICKHNWDFLHANSLDKCPDGDLLLSIRHSDTIYKISHDGSIVWRLGGKKSDFSQDFKFSRQHDATCHESNSTNAVISFLDNAAGGDVPPNPSNDYSRGFLVSLNVHNMDARVVAEYPHPEKRLQNARGSCEVLSNGNVFMGWSNRSLISEHSPNGDLLMSAKAMPDWIRAYRSYKFPFVGRPANAPDVVSQVVFAADEAQNRTSSASTDAPQVITEVYVSWNGATEVAYWNLHLSNATGDAVKLLASARREGFETRLRYGGLASRVILEAMDIFDRPLPHGMSASIKTLIPDPMDKASQHSHSVALDDAKAFELDALKTNILRPQPTGKETSWPSNAANMFIFGTGLGISIAAIIWTASKWIARDSPGPRQGRHTSVDGEESSQFLLNDIPNATR